MAIVDRIIGLASPTASFRRAIRLIERGREFEAFPLLTRAAKAGIADAEYRIARCYLQGSSVPPSRAEATRWLERAATHGSIEGQVLLAALYLQGLVVELSGDPTEGGRALFDEETTTDPDFETAAKWSRLAAMAGSAEAQALLGYVLTCGPEPIRDLGEAHRWYERSAAAGCPQGHLGYALSLARVANKESGLGQVVEHLRRAAAAELGSAIYLLGVLTEQGRGVAKDPARAAELFRDAAEKGHRAAQVSWGLKLIEGRDVEQDLVAGEFLVATGRPRRGP